MTASAPQGQQGRPERWPRAVSAEPLYVARAEVLGVLDGSEAGRSADPAHRRAAYAIVVLLALGIPRAGSAAAGDDRIGTSLAPWEVPVPADAHALASRVGLPVRDCASAIALLLASGACVRVPHETNVSVHPDETNVAGADAVTLAPALFRARPAADAVDWNRVLPAVEGSAPTLLAAWAFAELLRRPDRFASVPRAELAAHTLYGEGMVKRALARLVAAGVIDRAGPNAYRFSDAALGRAAAIGPAVARRAPAVERTDVAPDAPPAAAARVAFTAAGIPLELPRDVTIELEAEVDGRPTKLRLRFPSE